MLTTENVKKTAESTYDSASATAHQASISAMTGAGEAIEKGQAAVDKASAAAGQTYAQAADSASRASDVSKKATASTYDRAAEASYKVTEGALNKTGEIVNTAKEGVADKTEHVVGAASTLGSHAGQSYNKAAEHPVQGLESIADAAVDLTARAVDTSASVAGSALGATAGIAGAGMNAALSAAGRVVDAAANVTGAAVGAGVGVASATYEAGKSVVGLGPNKEEGVTEKCIFSLLNLMSKCNFNNERFYINGFSKAVKLGDWSSASSRHGRARLLASSPVGPITLVIGNEASDLDSLVSSIAFSCLRHRQHSSADARIYVPVVPIPRKDFPLRTECTYALRTCFQSNSFSDALIFWDDFELVVPKLPATTEVVLTDHNVPSSVLQALITQFGWRISGIIDHHQDSGLFPDADPRIVCPTGSATTLVTEMWKNTDLVPDALLAKMMLYTILLDTVGLKEEYGRTTPRDNVAVRYLLQTIGHAEDGSDVVEDMFKAIQAAKMDITHLSARDLLRKDYKQWQADGSRYGISSVTWDFQSWINRDGAENIAAECLEWMKANDLDILVVMTAFDHGNGFGGFCRELVIFFKGIVQEDLLKALEATELELERTGTMPANAVWYRQGNIKCSRKQVQPILNAILHSPSLI
ncbi:hypothetical protein BC832DRAFT_589616 [Gaertneriomyces semiglobifer]|nr:hypothetical protein BC832DRAFT_589616 [Gaertneriomyces semiglobifer]